eukprot:CAMPEP_0182481622 /NCGR_PEP_ID=MMETSP1319-20130603/37639_1 /TAXON_ID=172717 /ORGANISM="Bolidomonas pacifica, Strain RCC208" /LENGTH=44 /DNA_ID= /DNA_START= /DNA_END= /DNA_ORIENTATION=
MSVVQGLCAHIGSEATKFTEDTAVPPSAALAKANAPPLLHPTTS